MYVIYCICGVVFEEMIKILCEKWVINGMVFRVVMILRIKWLK